MPDPNENRTQRKRIGELLVDGGYVTPGQVEHALQIQDTKNERIGNILIDLGYLSEEKFVDFLSSMPGIASIELSACEIEKEILDLVPSDLARRLELVPIGKLGNTLTVGMVCPLDDVGRANLEDALDLKIRPVLCSRTALLKAFDRYYGQSDEAVLAEGDLSGLEGPMKLRRVAKLVEEIEDLPTLPDILNRVTAVANDPDSSASDMAKVIATDGSLSAKVLRLANSPAYGFSREISDIQQAIALLGFRETQALAVTVSIFDHLIDRTVLDFREYWKHSYACATLAKLISFSQKAGGKEYAFISGLLHDIGKVLLAMEMRAKHKDAYELHVDTGIPILEAEEKVMGITHAEAGYLLAEHWLLPTAVAKAIRYHHSPNMEPESAGPATTVYLADLFCKAELHHLEDIEEFYGDVPNALGVLGISEDVFRKILRAYRGMASQIMTI